MRVDRRGVLALAASALAAPAIVRGARAADAGAPVQAAVDRFAKLPATASCLVVAGAPPDPHWQAAHDPDLRLFIGSAFKTFVLAQFLREMEAGRLSEDTQMAIDDGVRSPVSPVFQNLTGTTTARSVLEAMITHSDNTATDMAMGAAGPDEVRALIADAGLSHTQIPDSTRMLTAYIAGAPEGVDVGWDDVQKLLKDDGPSRSALNEKVTVASTAADMVHWYQQALTGAFFQKPETLGEFKRIQAMADAIVLVVPPDTVAYAKGGRFPLPLPCRPDGRRRGAGHVLHRDQLDRPGRWRGRHAAVFPGGSVRHSTRGGPRRGLGPVL